jgi:hypothetical protein
MNTKKITHRHRQIDTKAYTQKHAQRAKGRKTHIDHTNTYMGTDTKTDIKTDCHMLRI